MFEVLLELSSVSDLVLRVPSSSLFVQGRPVSPATPEHQKESSWPPLLFKRYPLDTWFDIDISLSNSLKHSFLYFIDQ